MKKPLKPINLLIAILISAALSLIIALLGVDTGWVAVSFLFTVVILSVLLEHPDKPLAWKATMVILVFLLNVGLGEIKKGFDAVLQWLNPKPVVEEASSVLTSAEITELPLASPFPRIEGEDVAFTEPPVIKVEEEQNEENVENPEVQDESGNHARAINENALSYYGDEILKNIKAAREPLEIKNTYTTQKFQIADTSYEKPMDKLCRRFTVDSKGVLTFVIMKNRNDAVEIMDTVDWLVSVVKNDSVVLYEGVVNRNDEKAEFVCPLDKGNYVLVMLRTPVNQKTRKIIIESKFE